jgi:hypothetical protein
VTTIVGLDPGTTTGYVSSNVRTFVTGQMGPQEHHVELMQLLVNHEPDVVVCEAFTFRPNPGRRSVVLDSKEYIGVAKLYCHANEISYAEQQPNQGKGFWTDDKIKKVGLWEPGQRHAMDALRHVLYYITFSMNDHKWIRKLR